MCTVTYLPTGSNNFRLCVNRDESPLRAIAKPPEIRAMDGVYICAPTDPVAGGTWVGMSDKKRLVVLLNGAFNPHQRTLPYRKSRGIIALEFLTTQSFSETAGNIDLNKIEPFTLLCIDLKNTLRFRVLRWNGQYRFLQFLSPETPQLICSAPLYDRIQNKQRQRTFRKWLSESNGSTLEQQVALHKLSDTQKPVGFYLDRTVVKSVSVTGIEKISDYCAVYYEDLERGEIFKIDFPG